MPNLVGYVQNGGGSCLIPEGIFYIPARDIALSGTHSSSRADPDCHLAVDASRSNQEYGAQPTVMPASTDFLFGLYLGRPA